jgi:hypothetical protein
MLPGCFFCGVQETIFHWSLEIDHFPFRSSVNGFLMSWSMAADHRRRLEDQSISTDKAPPPEMRSESAIANSDSGYSNPLLFAKKCGQCTPTTAVNITQPMKNAPTRVNRPSVTNIPPTNSERAAAANHAEVGRMNVNGVFPEMNVLKPGPPKVPKTFCAPWAIITAPNPSRIGTVAQVGTVEAILRNMLYPSQLKFRRY